VLRLDRKKRKTIDGEGIPVPKMQKEGINFIADRLPDPAIGKETGRL